MKSYRLNQKPDSNLELIIWIVIALVGLGLVAWALTHPETLMEIVGA